MSSSPSSRSKRKTGHSATASRSTHPDFLLECERMQVLADHLQSPLTRHRAMLVLICVSAPSFMLQLDANIVAVSLPSISESLKANFAGIEWVVTAYTLCFASLLLPAGALADRFGRKRILMAGLALFTIASFFCGAAPNLAVLVAARAFQGIGAAMQLSAALATLSSSFKGDERARAFAFWGSVVGIGISMGPMVDFSFFRRPTYLGANVAQFAFAAGLLTMLTFMPIYFQHALGMSPRTAGLMMLPMALPLFIVPRIVTAHLSHRLTGRALLTAGLALVSAGLAFTALVAGHFDFRLMLAGMLVTGIGAGLLNGETTKGGMTVIPAERAGMASGISGTMRFTGIVIGFAGLGVVLFSRISSAITTALPTLNEHDRLGLIRDVASGDLSGAGIASAAGAVLHAVALRSFTEGYSTLFAASAGFCCLAAVITWLLVRASDKPPIAKPKKQSTFGQSN